MANDLSLVILSGGESSLMGVPKVELRLGGKLFIEHIHECLGSHFDETIIVGGAPRDIPAELRQVPDLFPARTPLVGIYSGLAAAQSSRCFVLACDMPMMSLNLVKLMAAHSPEADGTVPMIGGYLEPLCAFYHKRAAAALHAALDLGVRKVTTGIERLNLVVIPEVLLRTVDPDLRSFTNVNSPEDLRSLVAARWPAISGRP